MTWLTERLARDLDVELTPLVLIALVIATAIALYILRIALIVVIVAAQP